MIIDCIGCLHGAQPKLSGGDLLIVTGDLTAKDKAYQYVDFFLWLDRQRYKKKIVIAGNHDNVLQTIPEIITSLPDSISYLCDSGVEFQGLKIWGSPWTAQFLGINPACCAFTCNHSFDSEQWLSEKWAFIPDDTDIIVTHGPSFGNFDRIKNNHGSLGPSVGSLSLWERCLEIQPKLHVFSHIHEGYGFSKNSSGVLIANVSHMNEQYQPVNAPARFVL